MLQKENTKHKKIKYKLLLILLPAVIVQILILVFVSGALSRKSMKKMATNALNSSITNQADNIEAWLEGNIQNFSTVKQIIEKTQPSDKELQEILNACYGFNTYCKEGPYVGTASGKLFKAEESEKASSDPTQEIWFKQGMTRVDMSYGASYVNNGTAVVTASGLLVDGSNECKVFAADMNLKSIATIVNSGVKMDQASSFLLNKADNTILAHRDDSRINTVLSTSDGDALMAAIAAKINARDFETVELKGYAVAFREISGTEWLLVSYVSDDTILSDIYRLTNILVAVGLLAIVSIILLMNYIISRVVSPIGNITKNISDMSEGDFTIEVKKESDDEIGVMGDKVSDFIHSMRRMLSSINNESKKLKEQSDNSDRVSQQMFDAAKSQADAMSNLNNTVDQLGVAVNEIAKNANTLASVVSDTRNNTKQANESMKETVEISKKGRENMEKLSEAMENIKTGNAELVVSINEVGKASEEITKIVSLIAEIADQTNLLSLNASIEAARAGAAGKGFAVVASEIGNLAQNSAKSADNISQLIGEVQQAITTVVSQAETSAQNIEANGELINMAVDTFDQIYQNIQKSNDLIDSMIKNVEKVDDVAGSVAAISQEQAASTDEIIETSRKMVEQANSITESSHQVADNSHELANTSDTLTTYVQKFKI